MDRRATQYVKFAVERFGRLDCVVNNAGVGGEGGPIAGTSVEGLNKSIALLLGGTFLGIKYAVPNGTKIGAFGAIHRPGGARGFSPGACRF
jgi:NAD(P)-dependent dehydrogenase (short-subunit alcohol dehydrogenase family)